MTHYEYIYAEWVINPEGLDDSLGRISSLDAQAKDALNPAALQRVRSADCDRPCRSHGP